MKDLIDLQNAHVTQHSGKTGKRPWEVRANITDDLLHELPSNLSEKDMFLVLAFARKFEMIALNAGIDFGKKFNAHTFKQEREKLHKVISELEVANGKLAAKVHKFLEE